MGSLTDRKDFYHQVAVNSKRARSNMVPFCCSADEFRDLKAFGDYLDGLDSALPQDRWNAGDHFGEGKQRPILVSSGEMLYPTFGALFQGDHLGVEFALQGHQNMLISEGFLLPHRRVQGAHAFPLSSVVEGLIIDDYFILGCHDKNEPKENSEVFRQLERARAAYDKHQLPGSVGKDVCAEDLFKAAGAEFDSRDEVIGLGLSLLGSPLAKRLGLSLLSLRVAALEGISAQLAHRLSGSWVSVLLYRRCLSSLVDEFYSIGSSVAPEQSTAVLPLRRKPAEELAMLAVMVPFMVSDLSAPFLQTVYATDASLRKGAIVSKQISENVA